MKSILVIGARGIPNVEGGAEKHVERLFPLIADRGWHVTVAGMRPFVQSSRYRNLSLWHPPSVGFGLLNRMLYPLAAWVHALRTRPDIVHFVGPGPVLLLWAYKLLGSKIVVRYGADCCARSGDQNSRWTTRFARYQLRWADSIVAVTPTLARKLRAAAIGRNIKVVGNGCDRPDHFPETGPNPVRGDYMLYVGQPGHGNNIQSLISAFRVFAKSHPQMQLVIVGSWNWAFGPRPPIGDKRIICLGSLPRPELGPLYRDARFFVNPSIREGHSNTLLEAVCCRCPVLLSDLPENRDLQLNAKHYFDPENRQSIVSALNRAHANPDAFRVDDRRFRPWEEICEQTTGVYRNLFKEETNQPARQEKPSRI